MKKTNTTRPYLQLPRGILVDKEVYDHLTSRSLSVRLKSKKEPYAIIVDELGREIDLLHRFTFGFVHGFEKLLDARYEVHHAFANSRDNRVERLELRLIPDHRLLHRILLRKKRENHDVFGYWRPRERAEVRSVDPDLPLWERGDDMTASQLYTHPNRWPKAPLVPTLRQQLLEAKRKLADAFARLDEETRHLDSGRSIPRRTREGSPNDRVSRAAGIRYTRLGCLPWEAALVRLLVKHRLGPDAFDYTRAAQDIGVDEALLPRLRRDEHGMWAIENALRNWEVHQRLPKPGRDVRRYRA